MGQLHSLNVINLLLGQILYGWLFLCYNSDNIHHQHNGGKELSHVIFFCKVETYKKTQTVWCKIGRHRCDASRLLCPDALQIAQRTCDAYDADIYIRSRPGANSKPDVYIYDASAYWSRPDAVQDSNTCSRGPLGSALNSCYTCASHSRDKSTSANCFKSMSRQVN